MNRKQRSVWESDFREWLIINSVLNGIEVNDFRHIDEFILVSLKYGDIYYNQDFQNIGWASGASCASEMVWQIYQSAKDKKSVIKENVETITLKDGSTMHVIED